MMAGFAATAIVAVGRDEAYLGTCLAHLVRQGLRFAVIDNSGRSQVRCMLDQPALRDSLDAYLWLPRGPVFSLSEQLAAKETVARDLDCDWVIHLDVDEMMHSYRESERLVDALHRFDQAGFTAANFDEFVFLPLEGDYEGDTEGYPALHHYYFFEPAPNRLMRAWKKKVALSAARSGGHVLVGEGLRLAPESLALRHYIVRSQQHAMLKYTTRRFDAAELARSWHSNRVGFSAGDYRFPATSELRFLRDVNAVDLDRSRPRLKHYWSWQRPA